MSTNPQIQYCGQGIRKFKIDFTFIRTGLYVCIRIYIFIGTVF